MQASHQILTFFLLFISYIIDDDSTVIAQQQNINPFLISSTTQPTSNGKARYKTMYACEDRMLHIHCEIGTRINLIRANYGRFSITQCNEQGQLDLSTDCVSPLTVRIMRKECQDKQSCSVNATSTIFGDKCPKTRKYLEAHFQCVPITEVSTATSAIEVVNVRTSTTPSPQPSQPNLYEQSIWSGGQILPPNNEFNINNNNNNNNNRNGGSHSHKSTTLNNPVQPIFPSPGRYHHHQHQPQQQQETTYQQQQSKTVMNSDIVTFNAANDLQTNNYGPNNISTSSSVSEPILVTLRHHHTDFMSNPRCMFWNPSALEWTQLGARVIETNITHTICAFQQPASYVLVTDYMTPPTQAVPSSDPNTEPAVPLPFFKDHTNNPLSAQPDQGPPLPDLLNRQPVVVDGLTYNKNGLQQPQQQSNGTNPSQVVSFFSVFVYLITFIFVLLALMTIAFVVSSMRSSAGATLKSLGNFTAFSGPKYKSGRRSDGSLHHNKDQLLVINNQNGHQFLYTPTNTTKINSSASTHILANTLAGQHQGTLHQIQQQQQQHQLYSGNGTLSNLSGTGGQSNNYYYGLTGLNQLFHHQQQQQQQQHQHLSQHQLNNQQASYHHQANKSTISNESANSSPSSSGVESGSASMHQQQQQQQHQQHHPQQLQQSTCLVMNNDLNLMNHFGNYGQHQQPQQQQQLQQHQNPLTSLSMQDHHTTLTLNAHYNSSVGPMRFNNIQNNGLMREQHIYECVDDDKNYSARLLLPIEQYNSNTLSNHHQTNLGAAPRSVMTLSRFNQQPQHLQSQQLQAATNKRLTSHPAIVRDNQPTKTNIICSQMAQVTPQRATEINNFQHDVMAVFNNDNTATTTTTTSAPSVPNNNTSKLSTDC